MSPELRAYVAASRARQGLPPTVQDPAALERAAAALRLVDGTDAPADVPTQRRRRSRTGEATPA